MSQASLIVASRRLFLRNGAAALSGAAVALLAGREALPQSATMSQANLHEFAPTQFRAVGDARLAYRQFGKQGAPPLVCLQHFTGTMDNWDPIHTTGSLKTVPWCSWTIEG
ncbi:MAG: alpha/beta fold hydrolase [Candidatus Binatia bacterium]